MLLLYKYSCAPSKRAVSKELWRKLQVKQKLREPTLVSVSFVSPPARRTGTNGGPYAVKTAVGKFWQTEVRKP